MHHRIVTIAIGAAALAGGCGPSPLERQFVEDGGWRARTTMTRDDVVVESPYGEEETTWWADALDRESERIARLFELPRAGALVVRLVPVHVEATGDLALDLVRAGNTGRNAVAGYASSSQVVVYVPQGGVSGLEAMLSRAHVVRHELSHAFLARTLGERLPRWLHEGVASTLEEGVLPDGRPVVEGVPPDALFALDATPDEVDDLLAWGPPDQSEVEDPERTRRRYGLALGLVWHGLLARAGSFRERLDALATSSPDALRAEGRVCVAWLASLDPASSVRAALHADDPALRASALRRMCRWMADPSRADTRTPEFVALAVAALDERATREPAGRFLVFTQPSPALDEVLVAALCASVEPARALVGQALRVRAGGAADAERVAALWDALDPAERLTLASAASVLGLQLVPERG